MSSFRAYAINPKTGQREVATWLDNHFAHHQYGVQFADGEIYRECEIQNAESVGQGLEDDDE